MSTNKQARMSFVTAILKELSYERRNEIEENIKKEKTLSQLSPISVLSESDLSALKIDNLTIVKEICCDLALLALNLSLDFDYFKHFQFKTEKYYLTIYEERLKLLGYKTDGDYWKYAGETAPNREAVIENLFLYFSTVQMVDYRKEMNERNREQSMIGDSCFKVSTDSDNDSETSSINSNNTYSKQSERKGNEPPQNKTSNVDNIRPQYSTQHSSHSEKNYSQIHPQYSTQLSSNSEKNYSQIHHQYSTQLSSNSEKNKAESNSLKNETPTNTQEKNPQNTKKNCENDIMTQTSETEEKWICKDCTFSNNEKITNCEICFSPKSGTTSNVQLDVKENLDIKNEMNEDKSTTESVVVTKESAKDQWACNVCSFINSQESLNCKVCSDNHGNLSSLEKQNLNQKDSSDISSLKTDLPSLDDPVKEPVSTEIKEEEFKTKAQDTSEAPKSIVTMRQCFKCNQVKVDNDLTLCIECSETDSICVNKACTGLIPKKSNWCPSCGVKKDADMKFANCVKVRNRFRIIKEKWQCGFCYTLMNKNKTHCKKCNNTRDSFLE